MSCLWYGVLISEERGDTGGHPAWPTTGVSSQDNWGPRSYSPWEGANQALPEPAGDHKRGGMQLALHHARPGWSLSIQDPHKTSLCLSEEAAPTPVGMVEAPEVQRGREPIPYLGLTLTLLTSGIVGLRGTRASQTPYVSRAQGTVTNTLHVSQLLTPAPLSQNTRRR